VIGTSVYDWSPLEADKTRENLRRAFEDRKISQTDTWVDYQGERYWYSARIAPQIVEDEVTSAVIVTHEITARKATENALRESQEFLTQLGENLQQVYFLMASDCNEFFYVSEAFERIWGIPRADLLANPNLWFEAIHPADLHSVPTERMPDNALPTSEFEYRIIRPDGEVRWIHSRISLIRNEQGEACRVAGVADDITEAKLAEERLEQAERSLREANARYEDVAENIPGLLYQTQGDPHGELTSVPFMSKHVVDYTGYTAEEIRDNPHLLIQAIHPEDLPYYIETALAATAELLPFEAEFRMRNKTGEVAWLRCQSQGRRLPDGQIVYSGIAIDVTQRVEAERELQRVLETLEQRVQERTAELEKTNQKLEQEVAKHQRTEAALRESEQLFRELAETIADVFWLSDPDKKQLMYVSPAYETVFQRTRQSLYDRPTSFLDLVHPEDQAVVRNSLRQQAKGTYEQEYRIIRSDGKLRWIRTKAFPVLDDHGNVLRVAGLTQDITEAKNSEAAIREKNQVIDGILSNLPVIAWRIDHDGIIQYSGGRGLERVGLTDGEATERSIFDLAPRYREFFERALAGDSVSYFSEGPPENPWGFENVIAYDEVRGGGAVGFSIDVTERIQAQRALHESHQRFDRLVNSQFIGVVIGDAQGGVVEANDAFLDMIGHEREKLTAGSLASGQFMTDKSAARYQRKLKKLRRSGGSAPIELQLLRHNGKKLPVLVGVTSLDSAGERFLCIVLDISKRKKIEKRQRHIEMVLRQLLDLQEKERKLLSYDIHDGFVQDVVSVKMILEGQMHQLSTLPEKSAIKSIVERFQFADDVLGKAIRDGRRMISELRPMIIDEQGIVGAIEYLVNDTREKADIAIDFDHEIDFDRLPPLLENTVFRVVQETLSNVRRHSQCGKAEVTLFQKQDCLVISVIDDGVGFDRAAVPGARFGLQGIVERARLFGGKAQIETEPGAGTRVAVRLPLDGIGRWKQSGKTFSG